MRIFKHLKTEWFRYGFETIAVVVGILVAFALDNWNEERKLHKEELELLVDIQANLEATIENLILDTIGHTEDIFLYQRIEAYVINDLPYSIELDSAFGRLRLWRSPYTTSAAYKTLQSKGLEIIQNEALKNDIVQMYEVTYLELSDDYDRSEWNLSQSIVNPFFSKHIRNLHHTSLYMARPNDFESLKKNEEFLNILSLLLRQRKRGLEYYDVAMSAMNKLVRDIDKEIASRL